MQVSSRVAKPQTFHPNTAPTFEASPYLVCYDGGLASAAALRYACSYATPGRQIIAVYFPVVDQLEQLEADSPQRTLEGNIILAGAVANARKNGVEIQTASFPCRVKGPALVILAQECRDAHIFLGADSNAGSASANAFIDYVAAMAPADVTIVET